MPLKRLNLGGAGCGQKTFYFDDDFRNPWTPTETILIHHGSGRNSNFWYKWIPIFSKRYRIIRRDALGHGYSSAPPLGHPNMIGALLDEIVDTLNQPKIEKVQYLGESTGGIFGEFVAARNPERLHSLSICGSLLFPSKSAQDMLAVGYATPEKAIRALESRGRGEVVIPVLKTDQGAPEGFMDWWLEKFTIPSTEGICAYTELYVEKTSTLAESCIRSMFLCCCLPLRTIIEGHGHEIYLEQAEICQEKFLKFLETVKS
ncbi:Alpha/Beta hydrolase protein [Leptodontidium sp. MPI-SDFR-AT-0119]|nr:Alpha/Beta hydrolase protein [Leptodontidium sp. MPI-SDFR-AT-0119]